MPKISFADYLRKAVNGESLGATYYQFLLVHTEFIIFNGLPNVFINTFLMSQTGDMNIVLIYNCLNFFGTAVGMFFSAAVSHRFHSGVVSVLGILGFCILYLQLIIFNTRAADYVVLLGSTSGLASAFYWLSYSQLFTEFTDLGNRDSGMAIISIITSVVNSVVPFLAGAVISGLGGITGYNTVFGLAFAIAILTAVGAMRLPKPQNQDKQVRHKEAIRFVLKNRALLFGLLSEGCKGIREGAFSFILSILLYRMIQSEVLVGFNTFLSSLVAVISFLIISKRMKGPNRIHYMTAAVCALFIFGMISCLTMNPMILIAYTVVNSFFSGFIVNSSCGAFLDAVQVLPGAEGLRPELFAQKELFLATGRCIGIFIIMLMDWLSAGSTVWLSVSLVILTLSQIGTIAACRQAMKLVNEISLKECA
ncbi:MFS transporter [Caproiciproducens faecalis]|uniref:MFS transporter n=1 Tax=Caproiciproducens faecalis TaxID=2820301 RepID=A0ABS7DQ45_9FIRM|nr:MFS transporter [Caproiciproducens faecalis]MBW7573393.1 MFS transporter [Caproiciproducens faecalis]